MRYEDVVRFRRQLVAMRVLVAADIDGVWQVAAGVMVPACMHALQVCPAGMVLLTASNAPYGGRDTSDKLTFYTALTWISLPGRITPGICAKPAYLT
ncbi:hypothetical protein DBV23_12115 [Edwardsiella ictaluri]|nr:hypothetical protein B6E78_07155 [Edwardsiella ictaluri]AVZ82905.1 hypothetical protein DBV23_12115 [Edwardsiella ictaluri]